MGFGFGRRSGFDAVFAAVDEEVGKPNMIEFVAKTLLSRKFDDEKVRRTVTSSVAGTKT
jgi:hypothetical protein